MGHFSALSGGVALAMIMLPVITLSTEETLLLIPVSLREAAFALGVSYPRTVLKVILPAGASGVITGTLLAVARAAGETAPLLFTSFGSPYMEYSILKPWRRCRRRFSSMRQARTPNGSPLRGAPPSCSWSSCLP